MKLISYKDFLLLPKGTLFQVVTLDPTYLGDVKPSKFDAQELYLKESTDDVKGTFSYKLATGERTDLDEIRDDNNTFFNVWSLEETSFLTVALLKS